MLEKWSSIWHGFYPSACFTVSPRLCERTFTQAALGCNSWLAGSFAFKSFKKCVCVCSCLHLVADTLEQSSSELGVPSTTCTVSAACRSYLMAILSQWLKFSRLFAPALQLQQTHQAPSAPQNGTDWEKLAQWCSMKPHITYLTCVPTCAHLLSSILKSRLPRWAHTWLLWHQVWQEIGQATLAISQLWMMSRYPQGFQNFFQIRHCLNICRTGVPASRPLARRRVSDFTGLHCYSSYILIYHDIYI